MRNKIQYKLQPLSDFLTEYKEVNADNKYSPVAVGKYGIRKREDIYSKELANDYSKNKLIFKDTLTIGMGSKQIDIGILSQDIIYSVSPAYRTFRIKGINSDYLRYCLEHRNPDMSKRYLLAGCRQGKAVDVKRWIKYIIQVPDESDQKFIVRNLNYLDTLISKTKKELTLLDELVKSRFIEMFGDVYLNTKNYPITKLENIANIISGITKGRKVKEQVLEEVPYMAVSNVKDGYIDWTNIKTILATKEEIDKYRLYPNDILMTEGGDPDKLGRGAILHTTLKNCIHQNHIFRVRLDCTKVLPIYFSMYLKQPKAKQYFLKCAKQTTGIATINMTQLRSLPVILPSIKTQCIFSNFIERVDKSKAEVQKSLAKLEVLKKSLMQEYFG